MMINVVKTMPETTRLGMVYTTYKNGDDWGLVYDIVFTTLFISHVYSYAGFHQ